MQQYFGPLHNSDVETAAADRFAHETHNLPRAYIGRNKFLMATIDFLITKDDDWYTSAILPWHFTEELHVAWNIFRFNKTLMDYEPHQGVPRYVTQESESRSDSLVRRGLAFIIEHGFYQTELGKEHYLMNLKQIVEAVHETVYFGVIHELRRAENHYRVWMKKHGVPHVNAPNRTLNEDRWKWAIVQKDIKGLYVLDAELKDRMRRHGIEPNSWIFPSKMAIYASMVPEYFTEYSRIGPSAGSALENGASKFNTFRGLNVYETRHFDTDFMNDAPVDPLVRQRQIGEYYVMGEHERDFTNGIQIFCMRHDKFVTIRASDALDNAMNGNNTRLSNLTYTGTAHDVALKHPSARGWLELLKERYADATIEGLDGLITDAKADMQDVLAKGHAEFGITSGNTTARNNALAATLNAIQERSEHENRLLYMARVCADDHPMCKLMFLTQAQLQGGNGDLAQYPAFPAKILLFRPRMTYNMATAILCQGGAELGETFHGHHDFQLTDDIIHKVHIGHYTFYSKSVVRSPKHMYIADDVFCTGYVGGENVDFIKNVNELNQRVTDHSASLIATLEPFTNDTVGHPLSLRGDLINEEGIDDIAEPEPSSGLAAPGSYAMASHISEHYGISGSAPTDDENLHAVNGVMFRGASNHHDGNVFSIQVKNTGHWGPEVYDGVGAVRNGHYAHLRK